MDSFAGSRPSRRPSGWRASVSRFRAPWPETSRRAAPCSARMPRRAASSGPRAEGSPAASARTRHGPWRHSPARRGRILPGSVGPELFRAGLAGGRQPAGGYAAERGAHFLGAPVGEPLSQPGVRRAVTDGRGGRAGGMERGAAGWRNAGRFGRLRGVRRGRFQGRSGCLRACRWGSCSARAWWFPAAASCLARRHPEAASVSPADHRQSRQRRVHLRRRRRRRRRTAAQAVGFVAREVIDNGKNLAAVLASRQAQGGFVNAIACPSGLRGCSGSLPDRGRSRRSRPRRRSRSE